MDKTISLEIKYKISDSTKAFVGYFVKFPNVVSEGETMEELESNLIDALIQVACYASIIKSQTNI